MEPWVEKMHERFAQEEARRKAPCPTVDGMGFAKFPEGITEIPDSAFRNNKRLRFAVLPNTVKRIEKHAFLDCKYLEKVTLNEGLEEIGENAFTGCSFLREVVMPDSVRKVEANTFYKAAIEKPIFSASGDVLYCCPAATSKGEYTVPNHVKRIQSGAFFYREELKQVILPDGLEYIHKRAFLNTGIKRITLPASVKQVEAKSFWSCKHLEEVVLLCDSKVLETGAFYNCPTLKLITPGQALDYEERQRIRGLSILTANQKLELPKRDLWEDPRFASLARRCATGDTDAMMEFASLYEHLGDEEFYTSAANFWRYRALLYGSQKAIQWKKEWLQSNPDTPIPVALNPYYLGANGDKLRVLGFAFFDPEREYHFSSKDDSGVIEANSWCGTEDPDDDGFGMEELYDWWYLDEFLNPIPDTQVIRSNSWHDRQVSPERFAYYREQAGEALKRARSKG